MAHELTQKAAAFVELRQALNHCIEAGIPFTGILGKVLGGTP